MQFGRAFRPTLLLRIVEPIEGTPRIAVVCEPRLGWSKERPDVVQGSHHVCFEGFSIQLRLTTDLPLSYLGGQPFTITSSGVDLGRSPRTLSISDFHSPSGNAGELTGCLAFMKEPNRQVPPAAGPIRPLRPTVQYE